MKVLQADSRKEFIFVKLRNFCKKREITIKYMAPYMHEKNEFAKQGWKIIVIMKNTMLIDNRLSNNFWAKAMEITNYF